LLPRLAAIAVTPTTTRSNTMGTTAATPIISTLWIVQAAGRSVNWAYSHGTEGSAWPPGRSRFVDEHGLCGTSTPSAARSRQAEAASQRYLNAFQNIEPTLRCRPDFVQGTPVARETLRLAFVIPTARFQLKPPLFMSLALPELVLSPLHSGASAPLRRLPVNLRPVRFRRNRPIGSLLGSGRCSQASEIRAGLSHGAADRNGQRKRRTSQCSRR
jgi:hypothetical protein